MTPHKTPSLALASLPGATASPRGAGVAGCRYPGTGLPQNRVLLPNWAEPAWAASRPAPLAPPLWQHRGPEAGGPEPGGKLGHRARRSHSTASIPVSPPTLESTWSASELRQPGTWEQHRLQHSLALSFCAAGAGGAQCLTCTAMRTVAVARSPYPPKSAAWISSVYSGTSWGERLCQPQVGDELGGS